MKLEQIKSEQDVETYIEGCLNDAMHGIAGKGETIGNMKNLIIHLINLDRSKRDKEKPIKEIIKSGFDEMEESGELDRISEKLAIFEKNKTAIYQMIVGNANHRIIFGQADEMVEYMDQFDLVPTDEIIDKYR